MKTLALCMFLTTSAVLAQQARMPVARPAAPIAAYPPCGSRTLVGQPCIWQPPTAVVAGLLIGNGLGGAVTPGKDLPVWFYMDSSKFPDDIIPMSFSLQILLNSIVRDCASQESHINNGAIACGRSADCWGRGEWSCVSDVTVKP